MTFPRTMIQPVIGELNALVHGCNTMINALQTDSEQMVSQSQLIQDIFSGRGLSAVEQQMLAYINAVGTAVTRFTFVRDACSQFSQSLDSATPYSMAFINAEKVSLILDYIGLTGVFDDGYYNLDNAAGRVHVPTPTQPMPGPDPDQFDSTDRDTLRSWVNTIEDSKLIWHSKIYGINSEKLGLPTINGLVPDPTSVQQILAQLQGVVGLQRPESPQNFLDSNLYNQIVQTFPDPRTQQLLFTMMSTPTGQKFAAYLLYIGQKMGPNYISWDHLGESAGGLSDGGGFITMNLDDSSTTEADYTLQSAYLIHEGVESYFAGAKGIRQMGTSHADYVAEWFEGKFLSESGYTIPLAYGKSYADWLKGSGQGYKGEPANVDLSKIDNPGYYWSQNANPVNIDVGPVHIHLNDTDIHNIPNPGLDPKMLTTDDMHQFDPSAP